MPCNPRAYFCLSTEQSNAITVSFYIENIGK